MFCGPDLHHLKTNAFWTAKDIEDLPDKVDTTIPLSTFYQNSLNYFLKECTVINGRYMFDFKNEVFGNFSLDYTNIINNLKEYLHE